MAIQNKGTTAVDISYKKIDGTTNEVTLSGGQLYNKFDTMKIGDKISDYYEEITYEYQDGGPSGSLDLDKEVTNLTSVLYVSPIEPEEGKNIISVANHQSQEVVIKYSSTVQDGQFILSENSVIDLPILVEEGNPINSVYSFIRGMVNDRQVWEMDCSSVPSGNTTFSINSLAEYYYVTLDLNGATVTKDGVDALFPYPKWVLANTWLQNDIGYYIYQQGYTYTPPAPAHAEQGQYGYFNGYIYNEGEKYTAAPVTEDLDLVAHTTYGYWTGFICDFDTQGENVGCGCVCDQAGATGQYLWSEIENALKSKFPNRRLTGVYADNSYQTQIQFSTQTVDFVEGNWSEPVVPTNLSGTYLALTTEVIE